MKAKYIPRDWENIAAIKPNGDFQLNGNLK